HGADERRGHTDGCIRPGRRRRARGRGMGRPGLGGKMYLGLSGNRGAAVQLTGPWTSDEVSASGQVFEFRLWALLTEQSRGMLHIFLPLSDRGIDALAHRRTDEKWISIQAKGRSSLDGGEVHLVVWADSLKDDK